jgi:hypothetical protein
MDSKENSSVPYHVADVPTGTAPVEPVQPSELVAVAAIRALCERARVSE